MLDCYGTEGADYTNRASLEPFAQEVAKLI